MIDLEKKLVAQSESSHLALVPFTILGFPSIKLSTKALKILEEVGVFAYETAIPVHRGWSKETNSTIKTACRAALANGVTAEDVIKTFKNYRPNLYIVYRMAFGMRLEKALPRLTSNVDMLLPEWGVKNPTSMASVCRKYNVSFVDAVSPLMSCEEIEQRVRSSNSLVYLSCAPKTGSSLFSVSSIESTIRKIKLIKPEIHVFCGFGIKTPQDVQKLGSIEDCDGVIIGTALLASLSEGLDSFKRYIQKIALATKRKR